MKEAPKLKGAAFIEVLKWYGRKHGPERLRKIRQTLPAHLQPYITRVEEPTLGLLPGTWYDAELIRLVFQEMTRGLTPSATRQLAADAVKASVGTTLSGIYAGIIRALLSPTMLARHYQRIWRLYHNTGEFTVIIHSPTRHEFRLSDWPGHDSFICLMNLYATGLILEIIGVHNVSGQTIACVDRGDPYCSYLQTWIT